MRRTIFARPFALSTCLACACAVAFGQQPRARRGGLDNLSLPSSRGASSDASPADAPAGWQTFAPEGAGFTVSMPGVPEEPTAAGRHAGLTRQQLRSYRLSEGGLDYEIVRTPPLPPELFAGENFEDEFYAMLPRFLAQGARAGMPQFNLEMTGERAVESGGHAGREYEFSSRTHRSQVRVFLVDRGMLFVALTGAKSAFSEAKMRAYLDSFTLTR
ncbi:MAG TPA: hypothetical protein VM864_11920 [Pyrinomonadaceae bacterium]|jgi:hypothetical protein|nr:hypothetical protein [Pyrinomonadaceae bacterium]